MPTSTYFQKITFYENKTYYFIEGYDPYFENFSLIRISRNQTTAEINLSGGDKLYNRDEYEAILSPLLKTDGFRETIVATALLGFITILGGLYAVVALKQRQIGTLFGKHKLFTIEKVDFFPLTQSYQKKQNYVRGTNRYLSLLDVMNISKEFFYSFTYDLSLSVQENKCRDATTRLNISPIKPTDYFLSESQETKFVWNDFLLEPLKKIPSHQSWRMPIIHGFLAQANCSCLGRLFELTLIARRSRFYAGTRYRKRGINESGDVANDVETEQILYDLSHSRSVMSFLMLRASVPIFWTQETNAMKPKPPIIYNRIDYNYTATRKHFKNLFSRYGSPIIVVNLMKLTECSTENHLGQYFEKAVNTLNEELPKQLKLIYKALDLRKLYKEPYKNSSELIWSELSSLGRYLLDSVGYFYSVGDYSQPISVQFGAIRTNCVDCLDRTNVAQFAIGSEILAHQLSILGIIPEPHLSMDSQITDILSEMYDLMGDHLSLQYGGSVAHKKYAKDRPKMMKQSKELLTSIQRHYTNYFADLERQHAINLFLGIFKPDLYSDNLNNILKNDDDWLHHHTLIDHLSPEEWWVTPLQYFFNQLRVLYTLPLPTMVLFFPLEKKPQLPTWLAMYGDMYKPLRTIYDQQQAYQNHTLKNMTYKRPSQASIDRQYSLANFKRLKLERFDLKVNQIFTYEPWIKRALKEYESYLSNMRQIEDTHTEIESYGGDFRYVRSVKALITVNTQKTFETNDPMHYFDNSSTGFKHPDFSRSLTIHNDEMRFLRSDEVDSTSYSNYNRSNLMKNKLNKNESNSLSRFSSAIELDRPTPHIVKTMSTPPHFDSRMNNTSNKLRLPNIPKVATHTNTEQLLPNTIPSSLFNQIVPQLHNILSDSLSTAQPSPYELLSTNISETIFVKTRSTHTPHDPSTPFSIPINSLRIMHQISTPSNISATPTQICMAAEWLNSFKIRTKIEKINSNRQKQEKVSPLTKKLSGRLKHRIVNHNYSTHLPPGSELSVDMNIRRRHRSGLSRSLSPKQKSIEKLSSDGLNQLSILNISDIPKHLRDKNEIDNFNSVSNDTYDKYYTFANKFPATTSTNNNLGTNTTQMLENNKNNPENNSPMKIVLSGGFHQYAIKYTDKHPHILVLRPDDPEMEGVDNNLENGKNKINILQKKSNDSYTRIDTHNTPGALELSLPSPKRNNDNTSEIKYIPDTHKDGYTHEDRKKDTHTLLDNEPSLPNLVNNYYPISHHKDVYFDRNGQAWIAPHHTWLSSKMNLNFDEFFQLDTYYSNTYLAQESEFQLYILLADMKNHQFNYNYSFERANKAYIHDGLKSEEIADEVFIDGETYGAVVYGEDHASNNLKGVNVCVDSEVCVGKESGVSGVIKNAVEDLIYKSLDFRLQNYSNKEAYESWTMKGLEYTPGDHSHTHNDNDHNKINTCKNNDNYNHCDNNQPYGPYDYTEYKTPNILQQLGYNIETKKASMQSKSKVEEIHINPFWLDEHVIPLASYLPEDYPAIPNFFEFQAYL